MTSTTTLQPLWRPVRHPLAVRLPQLAIGRFLYGIGLALMVRAGIGVAPWDVLSQGIALLIGPLVQVTLPLLRMPEEVKA